MDTDRFDITGCERTMIAVVTTGNGGYEKLDYREVPVPEPGPGEVLLQVLAAGVNNTEINTRLGWYSSSVTDSTDATSDVQEDAAEQKSDGGWNKATPFPFIQGTDCCGRVVEAGDGADGVCVGARVLVRACMRPNGYDKMDNVWMASDFDGAFAQFVKVPAGKSSPSTATGRMKSWRRSLAPMARRRTCCTGQTCAAESVCWWQALRAASGRQQCSSQSGAAPM